MAQWLALRAPSRKIAGSTPAPHTTQSLAKKRLEAPLHKVNSSNSQRIPTLCLAPTLKRASVEVKKKTPCRNTSFVSVIFIKEEISFCGAVLPAR